MDGTVNDANLEVLAFDCAGAVGDKSLISVGAIFDAMTMGCFKFDSSLGGLDAAFVFSNALTGFAGLTTLAAVTVLISTTVASTFLMPFLPDATTGLASLIGFAAGLGADFAIAFTATLAVDLMAGLVIFLTADFGAGFTSAFATAFFAVLATGLGAGFTVFFAATFVTTLTAALTGTFLTAFFATVFIHCLPAELVFIQIKQSTHTHQKTNAFTLKLLRIYLPYKVVNKYSNIAKNQSARGL